jgi:hypothetical protein
MNAYSIRRVPWTCHWGRFGVAVEDLGLAGPKVDDVFLGLSSPGPRTGAPAHEVRRV